MPSLLSWLLRAEARKPLKVQLIVLFFVSVLLTIGYAAQRQVRSIVEREHIQVIIHGWDGFAWYAWLLAAPPMMYTIARFPITRGQFRKNISALVLTNGVIYVVISHLRLGCRLLPNLWLPDALDAPINWTSYLMTNLVLLPSDFITYLGFFGASLSIHLYFRHRYRADEAFRMKLRTAQLESDLAQAELRALRGQLHPHFLFNSFNAVTTLMRLGRTDEAVEMVAQLSALLRFAIDRTGKQELSLEEEMDFVRRYLEIERIRFGEKLILQFDVEPASLRCAVPNLLLQPLAENAIKHGISRRTRPGALRIACRRRDERLDIEIENDGPEGPAASANAPKSSGIGVSNTHRRLEKIYGSDYLLMMTPRSQGGMRVQLSLPWRYLARR
jgi:hypothetical protein